MNHESRAQFEIVDTSQRTFPFPASDQEEVWRNVAEDPVERLLPQYRGYIHRLLQSYFVDGCDQEDMLQEARLGLFKAVTRYRPDGGLSFRDYAAMCIRNAIRASARRGLRCKHLLLSRAIGIADLNGEDGDLIADICDPEKITLLRHTAHAILECIKSHLTPMERLALIAHLGGDSPTAITEKYQINAKQIDNALQRAKKKITARVTL